MCKRGLLAEYDMFPPLRNTVTLMIQLCFQLERLSAVNHLMLGFHHYPFELVGSPVIRSDSSSRTKLLYCLDIIHKNIFCYFLGNSPRVPAIINHKFLKKNLFFFSLGQIFLCDFFFFLGTKLGLNTGKIWAKLNI